MITARNQHYFCLRSVSQSFCSESSQQWRGLWEMGLHWTNSKQVLSASKQEAIPLLPVGCGKSKLLLGAFKHDASPSWPPACKRLWLPIPIRILELAVLWDVQNYTSLEDSNSFFRFLQYHIPLQPRRIYPHSYRCKNLKSHTDGP